MDLFHFPIPPFLRLCGFLKSICRVEERIGTVKSFMKKGIYNMKMNTSSVGQASRLSFHSWRRHLPHFQLFGDSRDVCPTGYYFITFTTNDKRSLLSSQKDSVFNAIRYLGSKKYELYAAVVMNNHAHTIINPTDTLSKIMHSIKSFTAHQINKASNRKGKLWQDENFDRAIRDEEEFLEKINYRAYA